MAGEMPLDDVILTQCAWRWQKVAMVIARTCEASEPSLDLDDDNGEVIAARIARLVKSGKLDSQGNLSNWRRSEVRLPNARGAIDRV